MKIEPVLKPYRRVHSEVSEVLDAYETRKEIERVLFEELHVNLAKQPVRMGVDPYVKNQRLLGATFVGYPSHGDKRPQRTVKLNEWGELPSAKVRKALAKVVDLTLEADEAGKEKLDDLKEKQDAITALWMGKRAYELPVSVNKDGTCYIQTTGVPYETGLEIAKLLAST